MPTYVRAIIGASECAMPAALVREGDVVVIAVGFPFLESLPASRYSRG